MAANERPSPRGGRGLKLRSGNGKREDRQERPSPRGGRGLKQDHLRMMVKAFGSARPHGAGVD